MTLTGYLGKLTCFRKNKRI